MNGKFRRKVAPSNRGSGWADTSPGHRNGASASETPAGNKAYYAQKLSGKRLELVYELADERVQRYLKAEIDHVASFVEPGHKILELGCGYGRVLAAVALKAAEAWGIDNSQENLELGRSRYPDLHFRSMDAQHLDFDDGCFDIVFGIQNFVSACKVPPKRLLVEALRVTRGNGKVLLSSYAASFWPQRLKWFRSQAEHGLIGRIDEESSGDGVIVGEDGFRATTFGPDDFQGLISSCQVFGKIYTVDESSIFCRVDK